MLASWTLVDVVLALGLLVSVLVGCWRGLVAEVLALLGWVVAYVAAQWFGAPVAAFIPVGAPGSDLNQVSGTLVAFVLAFIAWGLLSWLLAQAVKASVLSGADRLLGAGFGLGRGLLVALLVCALAGMTPLVQWEPWRQSQGVAALQVFLAQLRPVLPEPVVKFLPRQRS